MLPYVHTDRTDCQGRPPPPSHSSLALLARGQTGQDIRTGHGGGQTGQDIRTDWAGGQTGQDIRTDRAGGQTGQDIRTDRAGDRQVRTYGQTGRGTDRSGHTDRHGGGQTGQDIRTDMAGDRQVRTYGQTGRGTDRSGHTDRQVSWQRVRLKTGVFGPLHGFTSQDIKPHIIITLCTDPLTFPSSTTVQERCESEGGRPGLPVPNSPCGVCGRKATLNERTSPLRQKPSLTPSGQTSRHFFFPNDRPVVFSITRCCLHPPLVSLCCLLKLLCKLSLV